MTTSRYNTYCLSFFTKFYCVRLDVAPTYKQSFVLTPAIINKPLSLPCFTNNANIGMAKGQLDFVQHWFKWDLYTSNGYSEFRDAVTNPSRLKIDAITGI